MPEKKNDPLIGVNNNGGRRLIPKSRRIEQERRARLKAGNRKEDKAVILPRLQLIEALRMQARTRRAANAMMRVEPTTLEAFLEWQAADMLEKA
jgi:hypothetical protein